MNELQAVPLTVSTDARAALDELARMIAGWRKDRARQAVPHAPIGDRAAWHDLVAAGWPRFGITVDGEQPTTGCDLLALAELCGAELLTVPLVPTVGALRCLHRRDPASADAHDPALPLSLVLPAPGGRAMAAFGAGAALVAPDAAPAAPAAPAAFVDAATIGTDDAAGTFPLADLRGPMAPGAAARHGTDVREVALMYAATTVGCAARCLERSVAYSRDRHAYGAPIGSYQALRHMMADMYRDVELARSGLLGGLVEPDWLPLALYVTQVTQRVVAQSIQLHGGIGFTWDAGLHHHARHILVVRKLLARLRDVAPDGQEPRRAA